MTNEERKEARLRFQRAYDLGAKEASAALAGDLRGPSPMLWAFRHCMLVLLISAAALSDAVIAQTNQRSFDALIGHWAINKELCNEPDTTYQITQSSINLFAEVQRAIKKRLRIAKPNAWLLELYCKTVDQGSDIRQSVLMLDDAGDLYEYSRGMMEHRVTCPAPPNRMPRR